MSDADVELSGPDLCQGIALSALTESVPLLGHAQGEPTIVVRRGKELFAIGAVCTHYSRPLAEGLVEGDTVRCPWHHACFSLRTGEALRAPALNPVACRQVELRDGKVYVGDLIEPAAPTPARAPGLTGQGCHSRQCRYLGLPDHKGPVCRAFGSAASSALLPQ